MDPVSNDRSEHPNPSRRGGTPRRPSARPVAGTRRARRPDAQGADPSARRQPGDGSQARRRDPDPGARAGSSHSPRTSAGR